jgi:penicillin amidase
MDLMRRTAEGKLSEIFGEKTLKLDKFFRSLDLKGTASKIIKNMNPRILDFLRSYSEGINLFIEEHKSNLPFEFHALDYQPERWRPFDCAAIGRLMAYDMSPGFILDITLAEISETLGVTKAVSLVPKYPYNKPCITDNELQTKYKDTSATNQNTIVDNSNLPQTDLFSTMSSFFKANNFSTVGGSNSWVVRKSPNNPNVILANDPHLKLELPSRWAQMHVSCPGFNVVGLTIPGVPFFLIGRNSNIAWGITVTMLDDVDFYIERIDEKNKDYYLTPTGKRKFRFTPDTIKVRNAETVLYYIKSTERSNVISDNFITRFPEILFDLPEGYKAKQDFFRKFVLTYSWTGNVPTDEFSAAYGIMKSKNWNDFSASAVKWGTPGLNWTYADKSGNMGIRPSGLVPIRKSNNPLIPNPGWLPDYNWQGFIEASQLPFIFNPSKGYVSSSNNKVSRTYSGYLSNYFEPPSRAERIEEIVLQQKEFSVREVELMQNDNTSTYSRELVREILPVLERKIPNLNETEKTSLQLLRGWDYQFSPGFASASIYSAFFKNLIFSTFGDELNEKLIRSYTYTSSFVYMKILEMIHVNDSVWFDDKTTQIIENRDYMIVKAFRQGVAELMKKFNNTNPYSWRLKDLQKLELRHAFSKQSFVKGTVNFSPMQIGGNYTTINKNEWKIYDDYQVSHGSSARFIADMQDKYVHMGIPGGSSGDPMSPNYKDQVFIFFNSGYIKVLVSPNPAVNWEKRIEINPK